MSRLRLTAAMLACVTAMVAGLFSINSDIVGSVSGGAALAAACLAITLPFNANDPAARKRIMVASLAFVAALAASLWIALRTMAGLGALGALAGLAAAGLVLAAWAFKTRNRRRRSVWSSYYDE